MADTFAPLYADSIHGVIASSDLRRMQALAAEAEELLRQTGDVAAALEVLKAEIARAGSPS